MNNNRQKRAVAAAVIAGCTIGGALTAIVGGIFSVSPATTQPACVMTAILGGVAAAALLLRLQRNRGNGTAAPDAHQSVLEQVE